MLHRFCLLLLLASIMLAAAGKARDKHFWFDEILTLTISRLPVGPEMWDAMTAGFEFNPPLLYLVTHGAIQWFGEGHIAARLPQIIAGIGGLLIGFAVVSRGSNPVAGFWFVLLLSSTQMFAYFYEARPYSIVFFVTMLAWFIWQKIADQSQPRLMYLIALTMSLAVAILFHLWSIVLLPCFAASALALSYERKQFLWREIAAVCLALPVIAFCFPMIRASRGIVFGGPIYFPSLWNATIGFYLDNLGLLLLVFLGSTFILVSCATLRRKGAPAHLTLPLVPLHEMVLAGSLILSPLMIFAVTKLTHSAFMSRYALVACSGAAFWCARMLSSIASPNRLVSVGILMTLSLYYIGQSGKLATKGWSSTKDPAGDLSALTIPPYRNLPIIYAQPIEFVESDFYAPQDLAGRFVYVADSRMAIQFTQTDGVDTALLNGSRWLRLKGKVISYEEFLASYKKFVLLHDDNPEFNWLSPRLRQIGVRLTTIPSTGQRMLLCEFP